jgi:MFS family permease
VTDTTRPTGLKRQLRAAFRAHPGLARLATVRWAGQFGDGMFQAALTGAILFNPERHTDPVAVAAGFAVLLAPYSLVGPFAGAILDRWDRRSVLIVANLARLVLTLAAAAILVFDDSTVAPLVLSLTVIGISRFILSGISASLPHVVEQSWLVGTNATLATTAAVFGGIGAGISIALITAIGEGDAASGIAAGCSAVGSLIAVACLAGFRAGFLGPDHARLHPTGLAAIRAVAAGLFNGARAVWASLGVTTTLVGLGVHRLVFGANTLIMVLILHEQTGVGATSGIVGFGVAIACAAAGMFVAAVVTPLIIPRLGRSRTVIVALCFAFVIQLVFVGPVSPIPILIGAFLLGFAGQTIKLTGDAAMQIEIDDAHRGQVFALQDTVFNIGFVAAAAMAAAWIGASGSLSSAAIAASGLYLIGLIAIGANHRRSVRG